MHNLYKWLALLYLPEPVPLPQLSILETLIGGLLLEKHLSDVNDAIIQPLSTEAKDVPV